jgi:hypothetical protein
MQKAVEPLGMKVKAVDKEAGEWIVTDGRSLLRFMVRSLGKLLPIVCELLF